MSHKQHMLKKHKWVNGMLQTVDEVYESLEEAMAAALTVSIADADTLKIYNENGELVHQSSVSSTDTYA